jgi:hypothetical protein
MTHTEPDEPEPETTTRNQNHDEVPGPPSADTGDAGGGSGPSMSRRSVLRIGAAAGATAVGATAVPAEYSPVGDAEAIPPLIIGGAALAVGAIGGGVALGTAGGVAYNNWIDPANVEESDVDPEVSDFAAQNAYEAARATQIQGEQQRQSIAETHGYTYDESAGQAGGLGRYSTNISTAAETSYGRMLWDAVRATTMNGIAEGKQTSEIEQDVLREIDRRNTRLALELFTGWNATIESLAPVITSEIDNSLGVLKGQSGTETYDLQTIDTSGGDSESVVENDAGDTVIARTWLSTPVPISDVEGYDESSAKDIGDGETSRIPVLYLENSGAGEVMPGGKLAGLSGFSFPYNSSNDSLIGIDPTGNLGDVTAADGAMYHGVPEDNAVNATESIKADVSTYVSETVAATDAGAIDAGDLLGPGDLIEDDATSQGDALARQLAAAGINPQSGDAMTISHPDVGEVTGYLFAELSGDTVAEAGQSIPADIIEQAVFVPQATDTSDDGSTNTTDTDTTSDTSTPEMDPVLLDPSQAIQIVDVPQDTTVDVSGTSAVTVDSSNSELVLETGTDISTLDGDYTVTVEYEDSSGAAQSVTIPVTNWAPQNDAGTTWVTGMPSGADIATVTGVSVNGAVTGSARVPSPSDPTTGEDLQQRATEYQQARQDLDEAVAALEDEYGSGLPGGGGGGLGGSGGLIGLALAAVGGGWLAKELGLLDGN